MSKMEMKKTTLILVLGLFCATLSAQTIFDIQVDKLYLNKNDIIFVNEGELNSYDCEISTIKIRDFQHSLVLDCEEENEWWRSQDTLRIELDELEAFDQPSQFSEWLKDRKFGKATNATNTKHLSYIQYFDDNLFAQIDLANYNLENPTWELNRVEFWDYAFLRINGKYLIIVLLYEDDADVGGYIIPKGEGPVALLGSSQYDQEGRQIDTLNLEKYILPTSFFRIKESKNGFQIYDKLFQELILEETFSQIHFDQNYIFGINAKGTTIYDKSVLNIKAKNLTAAYDCFGSIQYLKDNKIQWLTPDGLTHDTFPLPNWNICGTITSIEREISKTHNGYFESFKTGFLSQNSERDSMKIANARSITSIKYLNSSFNHSFDEHTGLFAAFSFPYSYYLVEVGSNQQLISITSDKSAETKFIGNLEAFGYHHPIKFKENNLYGYYPQNEKAKYKKLEKFNFFFARFETEDGRKGWLDLSGNEYFKE